MSQQMHRSVTTKVLLLEMFLRCDTRKHRTLRNFDGHRFFFCDKTQKKDRSTMVLCWIVRVEDTRKVEEGEGNRH